MQKSLFRVVENSKFLNRLRNVHLEKSAVTGLFRASRSPKTAKTPLKVHLRLRFQNLGKPRTAGLCGRVAGACDCGPLSVLKSNGLHRPKIRLKKFGFSSKTVPANIVQKLPSQRCSKPLFIAFFNFSHKRPTFALTPESGYTLGFRRRIAHSGLHAETQGFTLVVAWRFISHLTFGQAKAGGSGCTPTACVRFLRRRGPAGLRNPVCNLAMLLFFALCAGIPTRAR